ncbi:MAG: PxxKW family cysteine-rich protein [Desulfosalsimonadaceae bacterium]
MKCTTVRKGEECPFMTANGCVFNGGSCREIVEACSGCNRVVDYEGGWFCSVAPDPAVKWKNGNCNLATHVSTETVEKKQKINPIKASKRR